MMLSKRQTVLYVVGIIALLLVGGGVASVLMATKKDPPQITREVVGPLVEVVRAERIDLEIEVEGHGTVRPTVKADVVPQVGGKVVNLHTNLVTGGFIPSGQTIIKIDEADFEIARRQAETAATAAAAQRAQAEAQVADAAARVADAQSDVDRMVALLQRGAGNERELRKARTALEIATASKRLAQSAIAAADSQIATARVQADQAALNIQRTTVTLPFDAMVTAESVDVGQFVTIGQPIASVYGTESVEIPVPLEDEQLKWFTQVPLAHEIAARQIPREALPIADVHARFAGRDCQWVGRVVRTEGTVDPRTRMMHIVVEVDDPLPVLRGESVEAKPPLIPGSFVNVTVRGRKLEGVFELPRYALHPGDVIWIAEDKKLRTRKVNVIRRTVDSVVIDKGLQDGELVIITSLDTMTEGMQIRLPESSSDEPAATDRSDDREAPQP